jgi:hypothetical protein
MTTTSSLLFPRAAAACAALALLIASGCKKTVDDATLTTNVHNALATDNAISQQPIQDTVQAGVVTLTGNVTDDTAKSVADEDAAKVEGVKEVVDNLTVAGVQVAPTVVSPSAPKVARKTTPQERQAIAAKQPLPPPTASTPPPPPQPTFKDVTVPAGTAIPVRITQTLDSETAQIGQSFSGVVTREVVEGGLVVIPAGSSVSGRVTDAKDAGHFKGHSILSIELTSVTRHRNPVPISTEAYTVEGKNRGTNSAEKIGGGAAVGAILGGIFGGGKGAAIGAAAGGGGGAAVQGFTRGQQVTIPSETVIRFRTANSFTVRTAEEPSNYEPEPGLQSR